MSEPIKSIVQLFQSSKPRTKLFIQKIPPGYTEDEFKELIKKFEDHINYFLFRPGKIIRDHYGHLIGLDNPNYGFALVNFKNPRYCPKFHREFNGYQVVDLHNIKSLLIVEFALNQEIPNPSKASILTQKSIGFRQLPIFREFLKTFPFAAKVEEERLLAKHQSIEIDLENLNVDETEIANDVKESELLDSKISLPISPTALEPIQVTYSTIMRRSLNSSSSDSISTPLTQFIKDSSLNSSLPPPKSLKKVKKSKKERANDKQNKQTERKSKESKDKKKKEKEKMKKQASAPKNQEKI